MFLFIILNNASIVVNVFPSLTGETQMDLRGYVTWPWRMSNLQMNTFPDGLHTPIPKKFISCKSSVVACHIQSRAFMPIICQKAAYGRGGRIKKSNLFMLLVTNGNVKPKQNTTTSCWIRLPIKAQFSPANAAVFFLQLSKRTNPASR